MTHYGWWFGLFWVGRLTGAVAACVAALVRPRRRFSQLLSGISLTRCGDWVSPGLTYEQLEQLDPISETEYSGRDSLTPQRIRSTRNGGEPRAVQELVAEEVQPAGVLEAVATEQPGNGEGAGAEGARPEEEGTSRISERIRRASLTWRSQPVDHGLLIRRPEVESVA